MLSRHERAVVHQLHPAKIAIDVLSAAGAIWLLWDHHLLDAVGVALVPPLIASALVMRFDLGPLRVSAAGERMLRFMTPAVQAARLLGFFAMAYGGWSHQVWIIALTSAWIAGWWWRVLTRPLPALR
jgi:hypothetical protein